MSSFVPSPQPPSDHRSGRGLRHRPKRGVIFGAVVCSLSLLLLPSTASAGEPTSASEYVPDTGNTRFGTPRLTWTMPPPLNLQPERARITLVLPPEWMPAPTVNRRGLHVPTTKDFVFGDPAALSARATVGSSIHLHVSAPRQALDFGLTLGPRNAVAILHFDPLVALGPRPRR